VPKISPIPRLLVIFRYMIQFLRWGVVNLAQPPSWRTNPCRLSATAYSKYSQQPSITGGRSSIRNLRTRHAVVTGTHLSSMKKLTKMKFLRCNTRFDKKREYRFSTCITSHIRQAFHKIHVLIIPNHLNKRNIDYVKHNLLNGTEIKTLTFTRKTHF
jgi:hypothetical protein